MTSSQPQHPVSDSTVSDSTASDGTVSEGTVSDSTDSQNNAEQLDGNAIGERPPNDRRSEHGLPGVNQFTDHEPMHSEDPALLMGGSETRDEIHTREWRERPDELPNDSETETRLLEAGAIGRPGSGGPGGLDDEEQALAEAFAPQDGELSAEEAALHVEPER